MTPQETASMRLGAALRARAKVKILQQEISFLEGEISELRLMIAVAPSPFFEEEKGRVEDQLEATLKREDGWHRAVDVLPTPCQHCFGEPVSFVPGAGGPQKTTCHYCGGTGIER